MASATLLAHSMLCLAMMVLVGVGLMMRASHSISSMHDGSLNVWLRQHPPKRATHDAELLRRQRLEQLIELPAAELADHASAVLASLSHSDYHVRRLAGGILSRLEAPAVTEHAAAIAELIEHSIDPSVRLHALQALGFADASTLAMYASRMVDCLTDGDPGVRWAAVDALNGLEAKELAKHAAGAIDTLMKRGDSSLAKSAVSAWAAKLESSDVPPGVMQAIGELNFQANFGGMDVAMMGAGDAGQQLGQGDG